MVLTICNKQYVLFVKYRTLTIRIQNFTTNSPMFSKLLAVKDALYNIRLSCWNAHWLGGSRGCELNGRHDGLSSYIQAEGIVGT